MEKCWEIRGCPEDMEPYCIFAIKGKMCELNCLFFYCPRKNPGVLDFFGKVEDIDLKKYEVKKERCLFCDVFIGYVRKKQKKAE